VGVWCIMPRVCVVEYTRTRATVSHLYGVILSTFAGAICKYNVVEGGVWKTVERIKYLQRLNFEPGFCGKGVSSAREKTELLQKCYRP
jgi:hypothetical protein